MEAPIRINPIDFETNVAIGIDFPLMGSTGAEFQLNYLTIDQAAANARNLLLTEPGERIMLPTFGCGLKRVVFENMTGELREAIRTRITNQFAFWLPYLAINQIAVDYNEDLNTIFISILVSLAINQLDTRLVTAVITLPS